MTGTLVNTGTVAAGSAIGLLLRRLAPNRISTGETHGASAAPEAEPSPVQTIVMQVLGLVTIALGVKWTLESRQALILVLSVVLGGVCGQLLGIEAGLARLAEHLKRITASSESSFVTGFVTASVLFCIGPMTILGSIQDGLQHDPKLLLIKSLMDGVSSVILASALGAGVIFSALTVLVIQGVLTVLSAQLKFMVQPRYLSEFTAVGGLIVMAIGIRLAGLKEIKAGNLLPALVFVVVLVFVAAHCHWIA